MPFYSDVTSETLARETSWGRKDLVPRSKIKIHIIFLRRNSFIGWAWEREIINNIPTTMCIINQQFQFCTLINWVLKIGMCIPSSTRQLLSRNIFTVYLLLSLIEKQLGEGRFTGLQSLRICIFFHSRCSIFCRFNTSRFPSLFSRESSTGNRWKRFAMKFTLNGFRFKILKWLSV